MTVMGAEHAAEAVTEVNIRAGLILAIRERESWGIIHTERIRI